MRQGETSQFFVIAFFEEIGQHGQSLLWITRGFQTLKNLWVVFSGKCADVSFQFSVIVKPGVNADIFRVSIPKCRADCRSQSCVRSVLAQRRRVGLTYRFSSGKPDPVRQATTSRQHPAALSFIRVLSIPQRISPAILTVFVARLLTHTPTGGAT